jgi:hypothetical protein
VRAAAAPVAPVAVAVATAVGIGLAVAAATTVVACDQPSRENIEKWRHTERGPGKLRDALGDRSLAAELRAAAAESLVAIDRTDDVRDALAHAASADREKVLDALLPLLWNDCKVADQMTAPTPAQITAKDALFTLRALATPHQQTAIDGYLADWLGGYYEGRAPLGLHHGEKIVRVLDGRIAPKLIDDAREILTRPEQGKGKYLVVTKVLLGGIAVSGAPAAVDFLLDLAEGKGPRRDYPDKDLPVRAMDALGGAYLDEREHLAPGPLVHALDRLQRIAASTEQPGANVNIAFELLAATGKTNCLKPLQELERSRDVVRTWEAAQMGLRCAGTEAVQPMAEGLPPDRDYERGILSKYFWDNITSLGPAAAPPARALLRSPSWVARLTGVEVLDKLGTAADADGVRALAKDATKLRGWWGKTQKGERASERTGANQPEPTLGQVAQEVADRLEKKH